MEDACVFRRRGGKPHHAFSTLILFWAQKGSDDVRSLQVSWDYRCGYVTREGGEKDMVVLMFVEMWMSSDKKQPAPHAAPTPLPPPPPPRGGGRIPQREHDSVSPRVRRPS